MLVREAKLSESRITVLIESGEDLMNSMCIFINNLMINSPLEIVSACDYKSLNHLHCEVRRIMVSV